MRDMEIQGRPFPLHHVSKRNSNFTTNRNFRENPSPSSESSQLSVPKLTTSTCKESGSSESSSFRLPKLRAFTRKELDSSESNSLRLPKLTASTRKEMDSSESSSLRLPKLTTTTRKESGSSESSRLSLPTLTASTRKESDSSESCSLRLPKLTTSTRKESGSSESRQLSVPKLTTSTRKDSDSSESSRLNLPKLSAFTRKESGRKTKVLRKIPEIEENNDEQDLEMNNKTFATKHKMTMGQEETMKKIRHRKLAIVPLPPIKLIASNGNFTGIGSYDNDNIEETKPKCRDRDPFSSNDDHNSLPRTINTKHGNVTAIISDETPSKVRQRRYIRLSELKKSRTAARQRVKDRLHQDIMNFDQCQNSMLSSSATLRGLKKLNANEVTIYRFRLSNYSRSDINTL